MTTSQTADALPGPLVEVTDLSKRFALPGGSRVHAVERVSLSIDPGTTVAVVGESGCGKSTFANLMVRLLEPDAGTIRLEGVDITKLRPAKLKPHRQKMQIIFQDPFASLDPRRTIGEAIAEPLVVHSIGDRASRDAMVVSLLERVGLLSAHLRLFPHQFSGGQRQRVCIARALALHPKLVVADEAVSALDVSIRAQVINLLMDLQEEMGLSYLFISHDLAVVERMAHRVAVMYLGQIVEIGPRAAIFDDPRHAYTKRLLAAVPIADPHARRERMIDDSEIASPVWGSGQSPELVNLVEVAPGHWVAQ